MTMPKALHPKDDMDKLDVSRNKDGLGLTSSKDCENTKNYNLEICNKNGKERQTASKCTKYHMKS